MAILAEGLATSYDVLSILADHPREPPHLCIRPRLFLQDCSLPTFQDLNRDVP